MAKDQPGTLKRVINGISYNTETSMKVAGTTFNAYDADPYGLTRDELFKTRYGAYFILSHLGWDFEEPLKIIPMEPDEAKHWLEKNLPTRPDILEFEFGRQSEVGEDESRFTLRMPLTLKMRLDLLAKARKQSMNAWIIRCIENCAVEQEKDQQ